MKSSITGFLLLVSLIFLQSCGTGYQRQNGSWVWTTNDESHGSRSTVIPEADDGSFEVLDRPQFAKDANYLYYEGKRVRGANPKALQFLGDEKSEYYKDDQHAFIRTEIIQRADPATFEVLEFPYSKDKNDVYCGTMPMMLSAGDLKSFKVINDDPWMKGMVSTMKREHFVEYNKSYQWVDSLDIEYVIVGEWGSAESAGKKFKGLYEVK